MITGRRDREVALRLLEEGLSAQQVACRTGHKRDTVSLWAKLAGMKLQTGRRGGLAPRVMPVLAADRRAHRSQGTRLDLADRGVIECGLSQGMSHGQIAALIGVHQSTVSREIGRSSEGGRYFARRAQARAEAQLARPKTPRLVENRQLRAAVVAGLNKRFSPQQISRRLRREYGGDDTMRVSHETIYQALYVQGRGSLRQELRVSKALRSGRTSRIPASKLPPKKGKPWLEGHHISTRPANVADRAVPGHWEGDLVIGAHHKSALITLVERASRYTMIRRLPDGYPSATVTDELIDMASGLREGLMKSLTWDQGSEMAEHARWTIATGAQVYFCDPHSPWQRGSNENTNGLIRDFFPKGTDFRTITDDEITEAQHLLNIRPRQTLDWETPAEVLHGQITHALTT